MAANAHPYVQLYALWVTDQDGYTQYRSHMKPILARYGGAFTLDIEEGRLLLAPPEGDVNRVFAISFPDAAASERFYADAQYQTVRHTFFEPAVSRVVKLGRLETD